MRRERLDQFRERLDLFLESLDEHPRAVMERQATWNGFFVVVLAALASAGLTEFGALPLAAIYVDEAFRLGGAASVVCLIAGVGVVMVASIQIHYHVERWLVRGPLIPNQVVRSLVRLGEGVVGLTAVGMLFYVGNRVGVLPRSFIDPFVASTHPSTTKLLVSAGLLLVWGFATGARTGTPVIRRTGAPCRDP